MKKMNTITFLYILQHKIIFKKTKKDEFLHEQRILSISIPDCHSPSILASMRCREKRDDPAGLLLMHSSNLRGDVSRVSAQYAREERSRYSNGIKPTRAVTLSDAAHRKL